MPDNLSPEARRKAMRAVKSKGTSPERRLWAMLAGLRISGWRKNASDVPGRPDVVFDDRRVALFVDGCFWHGCPQCRRGIPETNREFWLRKITRNKTRAKEVERELNEKGWTVVRIWEHELKNEKDAVRQRIVNALKKNERRDPRSSR